MDPSTTLSLNTEVAIILRAVMSQYPEDSRNREALEEASQIIMREEALRAALVDLEDTSRDRRTTRQLLRDRLQAILANT